MRREMMIVLFPIAFATSQMLGSVANGQLELTDENRSEQYQDSPSEDLEAIQGLWVRTVRTGLFSTTRVTKEIRGDTEVVTYYNSDGTVDNATASRSSCAAPAPSRFSLFQTGNTLLAQTREGKERAATNTCTR